MANVIEQIGRVTAILVGSFLMLNVFHLSLESAVGIAVFGATVGALIAYFYLLQRIHKNRKNYIVMNCHSLKKEKLQIKIY